MTQKPPNQKNSSEMPVFLPPGIHPGETPPLYRLPARTFEKLCRDLFTVEPDIALVDLWGTPGQGQNGIDLMATRSAGGIEVGQCKAYTKFKAHQIRKAVDEFFRHLPFWRERDVRRFVLFIACEVDETRCQATYLAERRRLAAEGIDFEMWSAPAIVNKLRPHRGIVSSYLAPPNYWADVICGAPTPPIIGGTAAHPDFALHVLAQQANELAGLLSDEAAGKLWSAREAWREGRREEALATVCMLRESPSAWHAYTPEVKAKIIRFEATAVLQSSGDAVKANRLADEAEKIGGEHVGGSVLRVLIRYATEGAEAALALAPESDELPVLELRAGLLFELGDVERSARVLDRLTDVHGLTAEGQRLRALVLLANRDVPNAQIAALRALELQPKWESVRFVAAITDYMSALSPAALDGRLPPWPLPVPWLLVKRDDDSISRLRRAERVFHELTSVGHLGSDEAKAYQGWRLSCLANDPDRQEEAVAYCRELLKSDPGHLPAFWWGMVRRFPIDVFTSVTYLESISDSGGTRLNEVTALAAGYLATDRPTEAVRLLDVARPQFYQRGETEVWGTWFGRAVAAGGATLPGLMQDGVEGQPSSFKLAIAEAAGDTDAVLATLDDRYRAAGEPMLLLELCSAAARAERWEYVASRAEELVVVFGTAESIRLASAAAANAGQNSLALELLDTNRGLFPGGRLPPELRRLRVRVQKALGVLPQAVSDAEELAREDPSPENLRALADAYHAMGDIKALAVLARQFLRIKEFTPRDLLWIARLIRVEDIVLSRNLWKRATEKPLNSEILGHAAFLGFEFGLDREAARLIRPLVEQAARGEPGSVLRNVDEVQKAYAESGGHEYGARVHEAYLTGTLPIHTVSADLGISLAELYHARLESNAATPDPLLQTPLFVRHGGRSTPTSDNRSIRDWRLHVDITGLMLAHHLGILEMVETACRPIRIAPDVVPSLLRLSTRVAHHQPSQVTAARDVLDAITRGLIEDVRPESPLEPGTTTPVEQPNVKTPHPDGEAPRAEVVRRIASFSSVARSLRTINAISEAEYLDAVGPPSAPREESLELHTGEEIICSAADIQMLAATGLLVHACEQFRLSISHLEVEELSSVVVEAERRSRLEQWLVDLVDRIRAGIGSGFYQVLPERPPRAVAEDEDDDPGEMFGLRTLLEQPPAEDNVFWIDDRMLSGLQHRLGMPIVGIVEILARLREAGHIPHTTYFHALDRLRAANVRFVAPSGDEVYYHLRRARVAGGVVAESPELANLRRYVAATLIQGKVLQRGFMPDGSLTDQNEIPYLVTLARSIDDALYRVWDDQSGDLNERRARSDWLVNKIYLDPASGRTLVGLNRPGENDRYLLASSVGGLIVRGMTLKDEYRGQFREWLTQRVLDPRFGADPNLGSVVAQIVMWHIRQLVADSGDELRAIKAVLFRELHDRLPSLVKKEIERDVEYMAEMRVAIRPIAQLGPWSFEHDDFVRAVADAINGRTARLKIAGEKGTVVEITPPPDPANCSDVLLTHPEREGPVTATDPLFCLLRERVEDRRVAFKEYRKYFVGSRKDFELEAARISALVDPVQRYNEVDNWRSASPIAFYHQLSEAIHAREPVTHDQLMPPDLEKFSAHFGIEVRDADAFSEIQGHAVESVLRDEGLTRALDRAIHLPRPLPRSVEIAFTNSDPSAQRGIIRELLRNAHSPVVIIHVVRLICLVAAGAPRFSNLVRRVARRLLSNRIASQVDGFLSILKWTEHRFSEHPAARSWTTAQRLAATWLHAGLLYESFLGAGADSSKLAETLEARMFVTRGLFERLRDYSHDIAHPNRVDRTSLLLTGLAYAFEALPGGVDDRLSTAAKQVVFYPHPETLHPRVTLLRDPLFAGDSLNSFLSRERSSAISALTNIDTTAFTSAGALRAFTKDSIDQLVGGDIEAWPKVYVVAGDLPLPAELREPLVAAASQTDFVALVSRDPQVGRVALIVASDQSVGVENDDLRRHLERALIKLAANSRGQSPDQPRNGSELPIADTLLDVALRLAWHEGTPEKASEKFAQLASSMVKEWPHLAEKWTNLAERLWSELPIELSRPMARLLVYTRAQG